MEFLEWQGLIMVAGRREGQRLWDLTERVLPEWAPRERISERDFNRRLVDEMLQAAGVARVAAPNRWMMAATGGFRLGWAAALAELERERRAGTYIVLLGAPDPRRMGVSFLVPFSLPRSSCYGQQWILSH